MDIGWSTQYDTHHKNIQLIALQMWSPSTAIDMIFLKFVFFSTGYYATPGL